MQIGFCVVNYSEKPLEEVLKIAADNGYDCVELPSYVGNGQVDAEDILKNHRAGELKKMVEGYGLRIASLSNHADSPLIMGPYSDGTVSSNKGGENPFRHRKHDTLRTAGGRAGSSGGGCIFRHGKLRTYQ